VLNAENNLSEIKRQGRKLFSVRGDKKNEKKADCSVFI